jgi:hypothetical protein
MDDREVRRVVTEYSSMIKRISYNYLKQPFDCDDICQTDYVSGVNFEIDGVSYVLIGFNLDMSPDELFEMAKEIILAR